MGDVLLRCVSFEDREVSNVSPVNEMMEVEPSMMEVERSTVQDTIPEPTHDDKTPEESPTTSAKASKLRAELLSYWYSEDARKPFCPKPFEETTA
jgi:hypothetical protein